MLGTILAALGFLTAVIGPIVTAAVSSPIVAANQQLQKVLAIAGVIVMLAGVAHDALLKWQSASHDNQLKLAGKKPV